MTAAKNPFPLRDLPIVSKRLAEGENLLADEVLLLGTLIGGGLAEEFWALRKLTLGGAGTKADFAILGKQKLLLLSLS